MSDLRLEKYATLLTEYCLKIKAKDEIIIHGPFIAQPLIKEVYKNLLLKGAFPIIRMTLDELEELFYFYAKDFQLDYCSPYRKYEIEHIKGEIFIRAKANLKNLSNVKPEKIVQSQKAAGPIKDIMLERSRKKEYTWTLCNFPNNALAQEAEMSLGEYEDFVFTACFIDEEDPIKKWYELSQKQKEIISFLSKKDKLIFKSEDTDLSFSIKDRIWINADGKNNLPDGEIFSSPVENSVNGIICFSYPAIYNGKEVENIKLEFKDGKVIKFSASKGEDFLKQMINMDEGSSFVGEIAFGMNDKIKKFTKSILFDEKIGGTIHLALGFSWPETAGQNKSSLHWDMIKDMKPNGEIYANGELIYQKGRFII